MVFKRVWPNDFRVWVGVYVCTQPQDSSLIWGSNIQFIPLKEDILSQSFNPGGAGGLIYLTVTEAQGIQNGLWPYQYISHEHKSCISPSEALL